ncbi:MAG: hypothetical protein OWT28_06455 [Firmicutes bacterium]|nr:hypothetical protein [Bacillota bacterium]
MPARKIFTAEDRKEVLRELVQKDEIKKLEDEKNKLYNEKIFYDECPECNKLVKFENKGNIQFIKNKKYLVMECPECHKNAYFLLDVKKTGSVMEGIVYVPIINKFTFSEINNGSHFYIKKKS